MSDETKPRTPSEVGGLVGVHYAVAELDAAHQATVSAHYRRRIEAVCREVTMLAAEMCEARKREEEQGR